MHLFALIVTVLVVAISATQSSIDTVKSRCDSLPLVQIDYDVLLRSSPFIIFRSTYDLHNCTTVIYAPAECGKPLATGTVYGIRPDCTYSYSLQEINNSTQWIATLSTTNSTLKYGNVYAKSDEKSAAYCVANCTPDGIDYNFVVCAGRTEKDEADVQKFLDTKLKGVPGIKNMIQGCPSN